MNRRKFIFSTILTSFFFGFKTHSKELIPIHVYKDPNCGCCKKWINILNKKEKYDIVENNISDVKSYILGKIKWKLKLVIKLKMDQKKR